jgi:ribosomal protein S18 acetylase RimI-like enzyme
LSGTSPWLIRRLIRTDLPEYRPLRLAALRDHPEAFGTSFEEELTADTGRLIADPPGITLGGFVDGRLVGSVAMAVPTRIKQRHKGHVGAVYVAPAWRGAGLAQALMSELIAHAKTASLVCLTLSVTVGNTAARRLYLGAGFTTYGIEPRSLIVDGRLLDEELMALKLCG